MASPRSAFSSASAVVALAALLVLPGCGGSAPAQPLVDIAPPDQPLPPPPPVVDDPAHPLAGVRNYAVEFVDPANTAQVDALCAAPYDLVVLEPARVVPPADHALAQAENRALVQRLQQSAGTNRAHKLVFAYINLAEADAMRWYWTWTRDWEGPAPRPADLPPWILGAESDGYEDLYAVAPWAPAWKALVHPQPAPPGGSEATAPTLCGDAIDAGYDGLWFDGLDADEDLRVVAAAIAAGGTATDAANALAHLAMSAIQWSRGRKPGLPIVLENAATLAIAHPELVPAADALAVEGLWYGAALGGEPDRWGDPRGHDQPVAPDDRASAYAAMVPWRHAGKPVFLLEYTVDHAAGVYAEAAKYCFIAYCSERALSQLTATPPTFTPGNK
jgi:cysteinyl-tRNA synthetase